MFSFFVFSFFLSSSCPSWILNFDLISFFFSHSIQHIKLIFFISNRFFTFSHTLFCSVCFTFFSVRINKSLSDDIFLFPILYLPFQLTLKLFCHFLSNSSVRFVISHYFCSFCSLSFPLQINKSRSDGIFLFPILNNILNWHLSLYCSFPADSETIFLYSSIIWVIVLFSSMFIIFLKIEGSALIQSEKRKRTRKKRKPFVFFCPFVFILLTL